MQLDTAWKYLSLVLLVCVVHTCEGFKMCREPCDDDNCPSIECHNGRCESGVCVCLHCWTGASCDQLSDEHAPRFVEENTTVIIPPSAEPGYVVTQVTATDDDLANCDGRDCPCADTEYLITNGNANKDFAIERKTGQINVAKYLYTDPGEHWSLRVAAVNKLKPATRRDEIDVLVYADGIHGYSRVRNEPEAHMMEDDKYSERAHSRHRRSAPNPSEATQPTVTEVTFFLVKRGRNENATSLRTADVVDFQMQVQFPGGNTDLLVELFAPDNYSTIMSLCNVRVTHVGINLNANLSDVNIELEAGDPNDNEVKRAILPFGIVSNSETQTDTAEKSMLYIEYSAILLGSSDVQNGSSYWVSAGAEYNNETEVWVGQASLVAEADLDAVDQPVFNFTGPTDVEIGTSAEYTVDMYISHPYQRLQFDAMAPVNSSDQGIVSICGVYLDGTGDNYACSLDKDTLTYSPYSTAGVRGNSVVSLDLGYVVNTGVRDDSNTMERNRITVKFVAFIYDDDSYIGRSVDLAAALTFGDPAVQIWAATMVITIIARSPMTLSGTPSFRVYLPSGNNNVSVNSVAMIDLDIDTPENSEGDYEIEALMPYNDSIAGASACKLTVVEQGYNTGCLGELDVNYTSRDGSDTSFDRLVLAPTRLRNGGYRTGDLADSTNANRITFRIAIQLLNVSYMTDGSTVFVTVGVKYGGNTMWASLLMLVVSDETSSYNETAPDFGMEHIAGTGEVAIGGHAAVYLDIITKPGKVLHPMDLEMVLPFENGSAVLSFCRVEIVSVGEDLPCVNQAQLNSSITYISKANDSVYDKTIVSFGLVCNVRNENDAETNETIESARIRILMVVKVEDHENLVNGSTRYISAGVMFTNTRMWVGQLKTTVLKDHTRVGYFASARPAVTIERADGVLTDIVSQSQTGLYNFHFKAPPKSYADWKITVSSSNPDISICHLRIVEHGYGIACLNTSIEGNYTQRTGAYENEEGFLELSVTNFVEDIREDNTTFDNTSVVIQAVVQVSSDASLATTSFDLKCEYGSDEETHAVPLEIEALSSTNDTLNDTMPSFAFDVVPIGDNDPYTTVNGEVKNFALEIETAPNSNNHLVVKFISPVDQEELIEICTAVITFVGKNLPCIDKRNFEPTLTKGSTGNMDERAELDLGYVCNVPISDDPEDNKIKIEASARTTLDKDKLAPGGSFWFSATTRVNADVIHVGQAQVNVSDVELYQDTEVNATMLNVTYNNTEPLIYGSPSEEVNASFIITVPTNSSARMKVNLTAPIAASAALTITSATVSSSGANLACFAKMQDLYNSPDYNIPSSRLMTSQNDTLLFDLYIVSNAGLTHRSGEYAEGDDVIVVTATYQMADSIQTENGSAQMVGAEVTYGGHTVYSEQPVYVLRSLDEEPNITLSAQLNDSLVYSSSNSINISAQLEHTATSRAEGHDVTALFYYPPYLKYDHIENMTYIRPVDSYEVTNASEKNGVAITLHGESDGSEAAGQAAFEASSESLHRAGHVHSSGHVYLSKLNKLTFQVIPPPSLACSEEVLGMAYGGVEEECKLSGSYSDSTGLNDEYEPKTRGIAFPRYLDVALGNLTTVTKILLEHPTNRSKITRLTLAYSQDGVNYQESDTLMPRGIAGTETLDVHSKVEARFVRLIVDEPKNSAVGIRAQLHGCVNSDEVSIADLCDQKQWENHERKGPYTRSMLLEGTTVYFCDPNPEQDMRGRCYFSTDGNQWTAMDRRVGSIKGFISSQSALYGMSPDGRGYLMSGDQGETWTAISSKLYDEAKASADFTPATDVPWGENSDLVPGVKAASSTYTLATWGGANYDGIFKTSGQVVDWTECCVDPN